tara:strand:+ start:90 stop:494 length:405 start_codon:yes stop_codon:yes gene_type:complete
MVQNFNIESEKPPFIYKRNPLVKNAFQIFQWKEEKRDYEPVGDYTLIDTEEDPELTEKTVMNIVTSLNGRTDRILNLKNLTSERLLYNIVDNKDAEESNLVTIMLRTHDGMGVSKENAVLKIEKGVFDGISNTT